MALSLILYQFKTYKILLLLSPMYLSYFKFYVQAKKYVRLHSLQVILQEDALPLCLYHSTITCLRHIQWIRRRYQRCTQLRCMDTVLTSGVSPLIRRTTSLCRLVITLSRYGTLVQGNAFGPLTLDMGCQVLSLEIGMLLLVQKVVRWRLWILLVGA
uniref:Uncharacterized protein n=1 Tax=Zea mays TaxID=4577 RepID=C4J3M5_MAIZE|nr:unknown [Zea mays]|eukprot:NP_001183122.1 uncharacterized protein LOC100501489 [Zea mays]